MEAEREPWGASHPALPSLLQASSGHGGGGGGGEGVEGGGPHRPAGGSCWLAAGSVGRGSCWRAAATDWLTLAVEPGLSLEDSQAQGAAGAAGAAGTGVGAGPLVAVVVVPPVFAVGSCCSVVG